MKELYQYLSRLSPLSEEAFKDLEKCFQVMTLKKNDYFIQSGVRAQRVALLLDGVVRAFFTNEDGKEYCKQFFVGPSIVGAYSSLLTKQPNRIPQQALTDCTLYVANYQQIVDLYDKHRDIERLGRRIAEFYFIEKEQKELEMGLLDAEQRYMIFRKQFPGLENLISQYHIASYLGVSPTQLSRVRRKMAGH